MKKEPWYIREFRQIWRNLDQDPVETEEDILQLLEDVRMENLEVRWKIWKLEKY